MTVPATVTGRALQLYAEAARLELAFVSLLESVYGERAGDMRYRSTTWPMSVFVAWQHWAQAMATLRMHWEWSRSLTGAEQGEAVRRCRKEVDRILAAKPPAAARSE